MKNNLVTRIAQYRIDEAGQGLVEYALIMGLVGFSAVIAMQTVAQHINKAFIGIGNIFSTYVP